MAAPPPAFSLESQRVRIQHFGAPRGTGLAIARILASLAVAAGVVGAVSMAPHGGGDAFTGLAILAGLALLLGLLALVPLTAMFGITALVALGARTRTAGLVVGKELRVESAAGTVAFAHADVVSVDGAQPGWAIVHLDDGDVIRAQIDAPEDASRLAGAVARGVARGPWIAPLYPIEAADPWVRRASVALVVASTVAACVLGGGPAAAGCFCGGIGLICWLTVLRPGPSRRRLAVGTDGVALRTDVSSRFIPFTRIDHVEPTESGGVLVLAGGERVPLAVVPPVSSAGPPGTAARVEMGWLRREALLARLATGRAASSAIAGVERMARQGRTLRAWREAVRDLVKEAPGYRAALLPTEQAAAIVEAGQAPPEARIGAVLALAGRTDPALDRRLRIAIESCADDITRLALSEALDDRLESWTLERIERARAR